MNTSHVTRRIAFSVAVLLLMIAPAAQASGQAHAGNTAPPGSAVPVTIVLVPEMGYADAPAVVLRRPGESPADVILLRAETATAEVLSEAVGGLLVIRKSRGDDPSGPPQVLRLTATEPVRNLAWAATLLRRLAAAEPREIQGVGTYRAVEIRLPAQQRRD